MGEKESTKVDFASVTFTDAYPWAEVDNRTLATIRDWGLAADAAVLNQGVAALGPTARWQQQTQILFNLHWLAFSSPAKPSA